MKIELEADKKTLEQVKKLVGEAHMFSRSDVDEEMEKNLMVLQHQMKKEIEESD